MAIKTYSQVVQSMQDNISLRRPTLDTKAGTVARDLFIDNPADQIAGVYRDMQLIQRTQSILNATGKILEQFGSNYGIAKDLGKRASGNAILTFNSLLNNINIPSGTTITAKTGAVFRVTANIIISASTKGIYASYASSISDQLHIAGISDQYAVQIPIEAINVGSNGNVPAYALVQTSISGVSNVTNITQTIGGANPQGDSQYRNEILAGLSGSAAGTSRGYKNSLLTVSGILSVYVASPGNPILTRDGTITQRNSDGTLSVLTTGTGGKVDIWINGTDIVNISESYVFHDLSGTGDITSLLNAHILGQTINNTSLTPLERRQSFIQTGELPLQPVDSVISLSGSISGANFVQDVNFTLVKDVNSETENTSFALDSLVFLQNFIGISGENVAKGNPNSVDALVFPAIKSIDNIRQSITVVNDLAKLDIADHTKITMPHKPLSTVLRATNLTTNERYTITDQNINSSTGLNESGQIFIDGSILPASQDLIQVDYNWYLTYDSGTDYFAPGNVKFTTNGIDWGRSNYISLESALLIRNGNHYNLGVTRYVDRVYSAFYCDTQTAIVQEATLIDQTGVVKALRQITITTGSGPVVYFVLPSLNLITLGVVPGDVINIISDAAPSNRSGTYTVASIIDENVLQIHQTNVALQIETANVTIQIISRLAATPGVSLATTAENIDGITNVVSVISEISGLELYTTKAGGTFSGNTIYLATDVSQAEIGESVLVYFNAHEIFNISKNNGTISNNNIILSTDDVLDFNSVLQPLNDIFNGVGVKPIFANYIATDVDVVARTAMSLLPFVGSTSTSLFVDKNNVQLTSRQPIEFDSLNNIIRSGPSYLTLTVDGAFSSGGTLAIKGTGWFKLEASINVSQVNVSGFFDLAQTITSQIGVVSNNYSVVKVSHASINNGNSTQDLILGGYELSNNKYDAGVATALLGTIQTSVNFSPIFNSNDITVLTIGSILNITFYVLAPNISESVQFTNGRGSLYSKYKYSRVDRVDLIAGFLNPSTFVISGNLRISRQSQPLANSTYLSDYSYFGPTENERLTIQYRYNNIIADATNAIESVRTLTADVLTRLGIKIVINVSATIILTSQAIDQGSQIIDQATSSVNNLITSQPMGTALDYSAILRVITAISGIQGADINVFDYVGSDFNGIANRKSINADANQYMFPGSVIITTGTR